MIDQETSDYIRLRSIDCGGCLHWYSKAKSQQRKRHPLMYADGKQVLVRRALYEAEVGPLRPDQSLTPTCEDECCVEPEHQKVLSLRQRSLLGASVGGKSVTRAAQVAKTRIFLGLTKLTPELVMEIRSSPEPGTVIAARLGVHDKTVSDVRLWKSWRHVGGNPFAGLGQA